MFYKPWFQIKIFEVGEGGISGLSLPQVKNPRDVKDLKKDLGYEEITSDSNSDENVAKKSPRPEVRFIPSKKTKKGVKKKKKDCTSSSSFEEEEDSRREEDPIHPELRKKIKKILSSEPIMSSLLTKKIKSRFDSNAGLPGKPSEAFKDNSRRVIEIGSSSDGESRRKSKKLKRLSETEKRKKQKKRRHDSSSSSSMSDSSHSSTLSSSTSSEKQNKKSAKVEESLLHQRVKMVNSGSIYIVLRKRAN